jgi:hypothetical protein
MATRFVAERNGTFKGARFPFVLSRNPLLRDLKEGENSFLTVCLCLASEVHPLGLPVAVLIPEPAAVAERETPIKLKTATPFWVTISNQQARIERTRNLFCRVRQEEDCSFPDSR